MDTSLSAIAARVGAGVSHVRSQAATQTPRLMDQKQASAGVKSAALDLINAALTIVPGTTGRDLDVMA